MKRDTKENQIIKKASYYFIFQRGIISVGTAAPENGIRDAFKEVLFFIGYSASNLGNLISAKTISGDKNILKEEIDIKKYDPNNFFTFLDLFKLEEIGRKKLEIKTLKLIKEQNII